MSRDDPMPAGLRPYIFRGYSAPPGIFYTEGLLGAHARHPSQRFCVRCVRIFRSYPVLST